MEKKFACYAYSISEQYGEQKVDFFATDDRESYIRFALFYARQNIRVNVISEGRVILAV